MEIKIRKMAAEDAACVFDMMRTFYSSPAVHTDGSEEIFASDIENCINDNPYLEGFIVECDGATAGYSMIAKSFSTEFGVPCIWIEDLYLKDGFRGKEIGKLVLDHVTDAYPGCIYRLEVEAANTRAVRLYEKAGFSVMPYLEMKKQIPTND